MSTSPPPFTAVELRHRRARLLEAAAGAGADVVVAYGAHRTGSAVPWLTTWQVTREAVAVLTADGSLRMQVGFHNHVPDARRTLDAAGLGDEVSAVEPDAATAVVETLARCGPRCTVGLVGPVPGAVREAVASWAKDVRSLDATYTRLRMTKSPEELVWMRYAAELTDDGATALLAAAGEGASEREMVAAAEHAYRALGGAHHICYVATTSMDRPDRAVPAQWASDRRAASGSVVVFELSAAWTPDYPAQLLRTATVAAPPSPCYARLHAVAEAVRDGVLRRVRAGAEPADLLTPLELVDAEGLTTVDDLVHGLGGGYLPPVLSGRTREPVGPDAEPLRAGATIVVQPNVCTRDLRAGVQTGELVVVTDDGYESLHRFPAGLLLTP